MKLFESGEWRKLHGTKITLDTVFHFISVFSTDEFKINFVKLRILLLSEIYHKSTILQQNEIFKNTAHVALRLYFIARLILSNGL